MLPNKFHGNLISSFSECLNPERFKIHFLGAVLRNSHYTGRSGCEIGKQAASLTSKNPNLPVGRLPVPFPDRVPSALGLDVVGRLLRGVRFHGGGRPARFFGCELPTGGAGRRKPADRPSLRLATHVFAGGSSPRGVGGP